jgi:excisionase family DNA binding protein
VSAERPPGQDALEAGSGSWLAELLTTRQIAELLQLKRSTVEDYARRGLLPSIKLGRHRRFVRSDVERAVADLRSAGNSVERNGRARS